MKGPTLVIVQSSNGWIFGGYAALSWSSSALYKPSNNCFLFTLTNAHNIQPTKIDVRTPSKAMYCRRSFGPTFGDGDLKIGDFSSSNKTSSSHFPVSYSSSNIGRGWTLFAGKEDFYTKEIEVYEVL